MEERIGSMQKDLIFFAESGVLILIVVEERIGLRSEKR